MVDLKKAVRKSVPKPSFRVSAGPLSTDFSVVVRGSKQLEAAVVLLAGNANGNPVSITLVSGGI